MAEIESDYKPWRSSLLMILIIVAFLCALVLNALFLFVFGRSKKLRRAPNLLLLNLAICDILSAVLWLLPALVATAKWKWLLGGAFCKFHGFIGMFGFSMNMFTLCVIAFEKFLKIFAPSKHSDAFYNYTITMIVVGSLWLLSTVMSFMPLIGWGRVKYFDYQLQCVPDYVESATNLDFFFVNTFCLPLLVMLVLYVATLIRIRVLKSRAAKGQKVILQEKTGVPGESFAAKMRRQQEKFKYGTKADDTDVAAAGNVHVTDGTQATQSDDDDSDDYTSDENEIFHDYEAYRLRRCEREMARRRKKVYAFRQQYLFMSLSMIAVTLIYVALWFPFFIVTYTWVHDPDNVGEAAYTTFSVVTFFGVSYKPLVYVLNKHIRRSVRQAFTRCKKANKKQLTPDYVTKYKADDETINDDTRQTSARASATTRHTLTRDQQGSADGEINDAKLDDLESVEL